MNLRNAFITAIRALGRNKMRSSLTSIGIIIGVFSVIVMFGLGSSARLAIKTKLSVMGTNTISVKDHLRPISERDIETLKSFDEIAHITPRHNDANMVVRFQDSHIKTEVLGVSDDYFRIMERYAEEGRLFNERESYQIAKVAVLGKTVVRELYGGRNPVGTILILENLPVKVIGVLNEKGESMTGHDFDDMIFTPYTTYLRRIKNQTEITTLYISASSEDRFDAAYDRVLTFFRQRHNLQPDQDNKFYINSTREKLKMANDVSAAMVILLAGIASISLFVGGVGIMNIMLVSVTERTREIGIRMAIGAKKRDIMMQFLIESTTLSLAGGIVGIISGLIVYYSITVLVEWPFVFSPGSVLVSSLFAAMVGIFFGYYPSRKASDLKPIEALKYE